MEKNMYAESSKENAINFLLFSCLGIAFEDENNTDKILIAAIERAYRDAASHVLSINDAEDKCRNTASGYLLIRIKEYTSEEDYNIWHNNTCINLMKCYHDCDYKDKTKQFTYGVAQKWVNMTIKYLYVANTIFKNFRCFEPFKKINDIVVNLHVPVDSYILKASARKNNNKNTLSLETDIAPKYHECYSDHEGLSFYISDNKKSQPWSKMNEKDYTKFQEELKKAVEEKYHGLTPIDWEGAAWIAQANIEKTREIEKKKKQYSQAKGNTK